MDKRQRDSLGWGKKTYNRGRGGSSWGKKTKFTSEESEYWREYWHERDEDECLQNEDMAIVARSVATYHHEWREYHMRSSTIPTDKFSTVCQICGNVIEMDLSKTVPPPEGEIHIAKSEEYQPVVHGDYVVLYDCCNCCPKLAGYGRLPGNNQICDCETCVAYKIRTENKICSCDQCAAKQSDDCKGVPDYPAWLPQLDDDLPTVGQKIYQGPWDGDAWDAICEDYEEVRDTLDRFYEYRDIGGPRRINNLCGLVREDNCVALLGEEPKLSDPTTNWDDHIPIMVLACFVGLHPIDLTHLLQHYHINDSDCCRRTFPKGSTDPVTCRDEDDSREFLFHVALQCNAPWTVLRIIAEKNPFALLFINHKGETAIHQAKLWEIDGFQAAELDRCIPMANLLMDYNYELPMNKVPLSQDKHDDYGPISRFEREIDPIELTIPPYPGDRPWSVAYKQRYANMYERNAESMAISVLSLCRISWGNREDVIEFWLNRGVYGNLPLPLFSLIAEYASPCAKQTPAAVAAALLLFSQKEMLQLLHRGFGTCTQAREWIHGVNDELTWRQEHFATHYLRQYIL